MTSPKSRDELAAAYLEQLPYPPYPVQEEALLNWFTSEQGVLVCAPTGTGKTLIAEAALFEALHTGRTAYYTTPLIALTEQKFQEMQDAARRWGFSPSEVGLVTGNRRVNPDAKVLVVVAEILLNRLLHRQAFDFSQVAAVVMDEFHNFADSERGVVWELALALLPPNVRLLLLSATVGNAPQFLQWLSQSHQRRVELVQGTVRRVPLSYHWVGDRLLNEQIEWMAEGDALTRRTPALLFCFNREECWTVAEQLKGKSLLAVGQQKLLADELKLHDFSQGAGPKLKPILQRGVGVHHAGVLPKYRRLVEDLFQRKMLAVCVCTETLAAGINLPARSVVLPALMKGPPGDKKMIDASSAHQIFGRAGRPQFDNEGHVFVLAHEDDVRIHRWREKFDSIPETTKDPGLLKARKDLKRKMPTRNPNEQYWSESQFTHLCQAPPGKLFSKAPLPWRLLAYMLQIDPDVSLLREFVGKRLMDTGRLAAAQRQLNHMLLTLHAGGYVELDPPPPSAEPPAVDRPATSTPPTSSSSEPTTSARVARRAVELARLLGHTTPDASLPNGAATPPPAYVPLRASPTEHLAKLLLLRSVNPLYGVFLSRQLGIANRDERIQAFESVLDLSTSLGAAVRVPKHDELPPGPLAQTRLDKELLLQGLASASQLVPLTQEEEDERYRNRTPFDEPPPRILTLAEKLKLLFDHDFPGVGDFRITPAWSAGELLLFGGDFNKYVTSKGLIKQEGIVFRHALRFILLCGEFAELPPPDYPADAWRSELNEISDRLASGCRNVDPSSTDKMLEEAKVADPLLANA